MITRLTGTLLEKQLPFVEIDVQGVGYVLEVSAQTFFKLPAVGEKCALRTQMVVREDAQLLYGFWDETERLLFRELVRVSGIGPRSALGILSKLEAAQLMLCVQTQDVDVLVKVPGVGKKTAERLLIELQGRLDTLTSSTSTHTVVSDVETQARDGLIGLGYKPAEVTKLLKKVYAPELSCEDLIRLALKEATPA